MQINGSFYYNAAIAAPDHKKEMEKDAANQTDNEINYAEILQNKKKEILEKVIKGETESSFQIGAQSFTAKEWDRFLERIDGVEDSVKQMLREEQEKRKKQAQMELQTESQTESGTDF